MYVFHKLSGLVYRVERFQGFFKPKADIICMDRKLYGAKFTVPASQIEEVPRAIALECAKLWAEKNK